MTGAVRKNVLSSDAFRVRLKPAPRRTLHGDAFQRTDCNSPIHTHQGRLIAFVSHYIPIGHTYRRVGERGLRFTAPLEPVRIVDDPDPNTGKWIESTWRDGSGKLYGWYHAEDLAPCARRLFIPRIGSLASTDDGLTWRLGAPLLQAPADLTDCHYENGFLAGGYGDFSVIRDRQKHYFYMHFSSYVSDERAQGIAVARFPMADRDAAAPKVELWADDAWRLADGRLPTPIFPAERGWRHADPTSFWGPAVHFNRDLGAHVMLLNRTANGASDIRQEGIYCSFNEHIDDPTGWTEPLCIIKGGGWYPQIVGLGPEDSDTKAGARARFFMTGFSAWEIEFSRDTSRPQDPPLEINWSTMLEQFARGPHGARPQSADSGKPQ